MIIWLNGPFGAGKTQTALALQDRLADSFICDPEELGFALRKVVPFTDQEDFQDIPLWREFTYRTLEHLHLTHSGPILVPMTLVVDQFYGDIIDKLRTAGIDVHHFTLLADKRTLLERLQARGDDHNSWPAKQIDRCLAALQAPRYAEHIETGSHTVRQVAEEIIDRTGLHPGVEAC